MSLSDVTLTLHSVRLSVSSAKCNGSCANLSLATDPCVYSSKVFVRSCIETSDCFEIINMASDCLILNDLAFLLNVGKGC